MPYYKSDDKTVLLIHIPRTGCSSVAEYFRKIFKVDEKYSPKFRTYEEILEEEPEAKSAKKFAVVRNPYNRIVSELYNRKLATNETSPEVIPSKLYDYFTECDKGQQDYLSIDRKIDNDIRILRTETLTEDMCMSGYIDFNLHTNMSFINKGRYIGLLNDESLRIINTRLRNEFALFGYEMITKESEKETYVNLAR